MTKPGESDFDKLVAAAMAKFNALSPEEQAAHREAQRQSWVEGERGLHESAATKGPTNPGALAERVAEDFYTIAPDYRTKARLVVLIDAALRAVRNEALEEAAKLVEFEMTRENIILDGDTLDCVAAALRALKEPTS